MGASVVAALALVDKLGQHRLHPTQTGGEGGDLCVLVFESRLLFLYRLDEDRDERAVGDGMVAVLIDVELGGPVDVDVVGHCGGDGLIPSSAQNAK